MARTKIVIDDAEDGSATGYVELSNQKGMAHDIGNYILGKLRSADGLTLLSGKEPDPEVKYVDRVVEKIVYKNVVKNVVEEKPAAKEGKEPSRIVVPRTRAVFRKK